MKTSARKYILIMVCVIFILASLTGCPGSIRSDAIRQLVEKENTGLERINQGLKAKTETIKKAVADLKDSQKRYLTILKLWEKELKRAQIFAASPGDLQNKLVREAVFIQFAQLEIDRTDAYDSLQKDFEAQADGLSTAFEKVVTAASKVQENLKQIDSYVHEPNYKFAAETIDLTTIGEALSEFDSTKKILQQVADAGESVQDTLGHIKVSDQHANIKELVDTLSLISSRLKELKQSEGSKQ
jgi:hypothetical protein